MGSKRRSEKNLQARMVTSAAAHPTRKTKPICGGRGTLRFDMWVCGLPHCVRYAGYVRSSAPTARLRLSRILAW